MLMRTPIAVLASTGGRDFEDGRFVYDQLVKLLNQHDIELIKVGDARGWDTLMKISAIGLGINVQVYKADWTNLRYPDRRIKIASDGRMYDAQAGHRRNGLILDHGRRPDALLAGPGGAGTRDMTKQAIERGIQVIYANA